jgi:alpha-glucosidase
MTRTGLPFMRPVFLDYPQQENSYNDDRDFLFGSDLFVAPVTTETLDAEEIQLPPGDWYDYWTSQKHASTEKIALHPTLDELPLYVRAGAIIPMQPIVQNTEEKPNGPLEIKVYAGGNCRGSLYEDDGHTFAYQRGEFRRTNFACEVSSNAITVSATTEKSAYQPWWHAARVAIVGAPAEPKELRIGQEVTHDWQYDAKSHSVIVTIPNAPENWTIHLLF